MGRMCRLVIMEIKMLRLLLAGGVALLLGGCASIATDSTQSLRLEAIDQDGKDVAGLQCELENDKGKYSGKTPATVLVRKSAENLSISCGEGDEAARAQLVSRASGGMFGNILFGGVVGAIIDHNKGAGYNYPAWVRLVVGKYLTFDRTDFKEGQPTLGAEAPSVAAATAAPGRAVAIQSPKEGK